MTRCHPTELDRTAFVRGELAQARQYIFEAHVSACRTCAALLQQDAQVELILQAVARTQRCGTLAEPRMGPALPPRRFEPARRWHAWSRAALAAAASTWVILAAVQAPSRALGLPTKQVSDFAPEGRHGTQWAAQDAQASAVGAVAHAEDAGALDAR